MFVNSDQVTANIFNSHFINIVKNLFTQSGESSLDPDIKTFKDLVKVSIEKYEKHNIINLMRSEPW